MVRKKSRTVLVVTRRIAAFRTSIHLHLVRFMLTRLVRSPCGAMLYKSHRVFLCPESRTTFQTDFAIRPDFNRIELWLDEYMSRNRGDRKRACVQTGIMIGPRTRFTGLINMCVVGVRCVFTSRQNWCKSLDVHHSTRPSSSLSESTWITLVDRRVLNVWSYLRRSCRANY